MNAYYYGCALSCCFCITLVWLDGSSTFRFSVMNRSIHRPFALISIPFESIRVRPWLGELKQIHKCQQPLIFNRGWRSICKVSFFHHETIELVVRSIWFRRISNPPTYEPNLKSSHWSEKLTDISVWKGCCCLTTDTQRMRMKRLYREACIIASSAARSRKARQSLSQRFIACLVVVVWQALTVVRDDRLLECWRLHWDVWAPWM